MARYDCNYYRQRYVAADVTLADLAALPNAPKLDTLKKRSAREDWTGQREAFRHQASTKTRELASTTEAEIAARHARIAKALQHKALERLQTLTIAELKPATMPYTSRTPPRSNAKRSVSTACECSTSTSR